MASLNGQTIASSYEQLLHVDRDGGGNDNTLVSVKDGDNGTTFGIKLATNKVEIIPGSNDTNAFEVSQADGTAVLTVDSTNARVGIGGSPVSMLHLRKASGEFGIRLTNDATGHTTGDGGFIHLDTNNDLDIGTKDSTNFIFKTANAERMRIQNDGIVSFTGDIELNGSGTRQIRFDDGDESEGAIVFDETTDGFVFKVGGTSGSGKVDALTIDNTGQLSIVEKIIHSGDTDTFIRFVDNEIKFAAGNTTPLELASTTGTAMTVGGTVSIGSIADEGNAIITNGVDGGRYDVLTVQENGAERWTLSFEGNAAENALTLNSNAQANVANIEPDGTIYLGTQQSTLAKNSSHRLVVQAPANTGSWINTFANNSYPTYQLYRTNNTTIGNFSVTADNDTIGAINWYGSSASAHTLGAAIDVRQVGTDDCDPNTPTKMDFYVSNGANISNELMSLNGPSQMVGIGTGSPTSTKLHVSGASGTNTGIRVTGGGYLASAIRYEDSDSDGAYFDIGTVSTSGAGNGKLEVRNQSGSALVHIENDGDLQVNMNTTGFIAIKGSASVALADDASINVDIGDNQLIMLSENSLGRGALFHCTFSQATPNRMSDPNSIYAASDADNHVCVFSSSNSKTVTIKNRLGAQHNFRIMVFGV